MPPPLRSMFVLIALLLPIVAARADALQDAATATARKDYAAALRLLEPLAQGGNARAQTQLAALHYHGLGVAENDQAAALWYERAARQGHAPAQFQLANLYAYGHAQPADGGDAMRLAAQWYFEAARQGHADAQYALGILFLAGSGVTASPTEARKWFARAARQGHADAQSYLRTARTGSELR
jgi:TPR repeat protein